jgi:hypothetical protein
MSGCPALIRTSTTKPKENKQEAEIGETRVQDQPGLHRYLVSKIQTKRGGKKKSKDLSFTLRS